MAEVYDPQIPIHENEVYVTRSKQIMAENDALLRGDELEEGAAGDIVWSPSSIEDDKTDSKAN